MRLEDLIGKELVGLPDRVTKTVKSIKPMPMPYDLLPSEMRARSAKERQERRRKKKKSSGASLPASDERSQSLLHWAWEPSLSDTQISLSIAGRQGRLRHRRPRKPVFARSPMMVDTEEDRTEMLRRLQERQVMDADRRKVAIMAKRSARECEIASNTFKPATRRLPDFYTDRLIVDGERKPGQSRVDCRRRRKNLSARPVGHRWSIPKSAWSDASISHSRTDAALAATATAARNSQIRLASEPESELEPTRSLAEPAVPRRARSPITVIPQVAAELQDQQAETTAAVSASAEVAAAAMSPSEVISHKVGPPGLDIPVGWEVGEVGAGSYYFFHLDDPGKIYWDGPPWLKEVSKDGKGGDEHVTTGTDENDQTAAVDKIDDHVSGTYAGVDDASDVATLAAIDAELAALDRSLGQAATPATSQPLAAGGSASMATALDQSHFESESVSSVSEMDELVGHGSDGGVSDESYSFDED